MYHEAKPNRIPTDPPPCHPTADQPPEPPTLKTPSKETSNPNTTRPINKTTQPANKQSSRAAEQPSTTNSRAAATAASNGLFNEPEPVPRKGKPKPIAVPGHHPRRTAAVLKSHKKFGKYFFKTIAIK